MFHLTQLTFFDQSRTQTSGMEAHPLPWPVAATATQLVRDSEYSRGSSFQQRGKVRQAASLHAPCVAAADCCRLTATSSSHLALSRRAIPKANRTVITPASAPPRRQRRGTDIHMPQTQLNPAQTGPKSRAPVFIFLSLPLRQARLPHAPTWLVTSLLPLPSSSFLPSSLPPSPTTAPAPSRPRREGG